MSRLLISPRHLSAIGLHAQVSYPQECCGVLIGRFLDPQGRRVRVERILAARNECACHSTCESDDPPAVTNSRYEISPQTVISAHRHARQQGFEVVGYYHSHPDHEARPSDLDLDHAWARLSYLIVSVQQGQPESIRSWRLAEDRSCFEEQTLDVGGMPVATLATTGRRVTGGPLP